MGSELEIVGDITDILPFTSYVGQTTIEDADVDEHQNTTGNQCDLGLDGCFKGLKIAILSLYAYEGAYDGALAALEEKGFEIFFWKSVPSIDIFREMMATA